MYERRIEFKDPDCPRITVETSGPCDLPDCGCGIVMGSPGTGLCYDAMTAEEALELAEALTEAAAVFQGDGAHKVI